MPISASGSHLGSQRLLEITQKYGFCEFIVNLKSHSMTGPLHKFELNVHCAILSAIVDAVVTRNSRNDYYG